MPLDRQYTNLRKKLDRTLQYKDFKKLPGLRREMASLQLKFQQEMDRQKVPAEPRKSYKFEAFLEKLRHIKIKSKVKRNGIDKRKES